MSSTDGFDDNETRRPVAASVAIMAAMVLCCWSTTAGADEPSSSLWMATAEVGVGPIDEDIFLNLTPGLTFMRPVPLPDQLCDTGDCQTLFETSLHLPLRLRIVDREPVQDEILRREDWLELADYFRIIRRIEYGTSDAPLHVRAGELGPANLGHATILNGYYNVVTTDHYRPGVQAHINQRRWSADVLLNDMIGPTLLGVHGRAKPPQLYEEDSSWQRFSVGTTVVTDFNAPTRLAAADGEDVAVAGPDRRPLIETAQPTVIAGVDARWEALRRSTWSLTPYADLNRHLSLGTGLHTGVMWHQNFGPSLRLSSRLEYRLMSGHYLPDYIDPLYEITRFQHPTFDDAGFAGPKLTALRSTEARRRHGGFGQFQARIVDYISLAAAYSDGTGFTGSTFRLRASVDIEERARLGLFYYKSAPGEGRFVAKLGELFDLDGALAAVEGRFGIWGPIYAHGQFSRLWRLRDDGEFENIHLFNAGLGAGTTF